MSRLVQIYQGGDLVVSKIHLESLGIRPGDNIILQPQRRTSPTPIDEKINRLAILTRLAEAWTIDELNDIEEKRAELWQPWDTFNS